MTSHPWITHPVNIIYIIPFLTITSVFAAPLLSLPSSSSSRLDKAWHGVLLPSSEGGIPFLPFYVPVGSQSYDDTSSKAVFTPAEAWISKEGSLYEGGSAHSSAVGGSMVDFSFKGSEVEVYGSTGPDHPVVMIYLDNVHVSTQDLYSPHPYQSQPIYRSPSVIPAHPSTSNAHTITIVNTGTKTIQSSDIFWEVDAFVINPMTQDWGSLRKGTGVERREAGGWTLEQRGETGVAAMQLTIISEDYAVIVDKVEHNPLTIDGHPAWSSLYNLKTHEVTPIDIASNSFCAGGTFLSNGTLISVGGNPVVHAETGAADFGNLNGLQSIRILEGCSSSGECSWAESPDRVRMASPRWYTTVIRLDDGSGMIIGGSTSGGWINNKTVNNPTYEFFPPKGDGLGVRSPFLEDTLASNLFPIAITLPSGLVFLAANNDAMLYDWRANKERRLPSFPNGVRVTYPMSGTAVLLPLSEANGWEAEVLICGGSSLDDMTPDWKIDSSDPASDQCVRMVLNDAGIAAGWQVEKLPHGWMMPEAVLLPDGDVLLVNGAKTGVAGYGNVKNQVGQSNCANPVFQPVLYRPSAPSGSRFSSLGLPTSSIPRLYHSVASLTPSGKIMIAGSNPNLDRTTTLYGTEYRVEWLSPSYMQAGLARPTFSGLGEKLEFGQKVTLVVEGDLRGKDVKVALMDLGWITHAVHMNSRLVYLTNSISPSGDSIVISVPPNGKVYPPGPAFLYLVVDGVVSEGKKVLVGDGKSPVVSTEAINNLLKNGIKPDLLSTHGSENLFSRMFSS